MVQLVPGFKNKSRIRPRDEMQLKLIPSVYQRATHCQYDWTPNSGERVQLTVTTAMYG